MWKIVRLPKLMWHNIYERVKKNKIYQMSLAILYIYIYTYR